MKIAKTAPYFYYRPAVTFPAPTSSDVLFLLLYVNHDPGHACWIRLSELLRPSAKRTRSTPSSSRSSPTLPFRRWRISPSAIRWPTACRSQDRPRCWRPVTVMNWSSSSSCSEFHMVLEVTKDSYNNNHEEHDRIPLIV